MGFDFGSKRIGIAIGQEVTRTVNPLTTINAKNNKPDWDAISRLLKEWQPDLLVVGLPVHMDGTDQPVTKAATRFANQLNGRYQLPVEMVDERLTSYEAENQLSAQSHFHDKAQIDMIAAQLILESWMSQQQGN